jgi:hypothetical protein
MENSFQTSFIPKKPIDTSVRAIKPEKKPKNHFMGLAFLIFIFIAVASGGLYFYKSYLVNQKKVLIANLEQVKNSFSQETIKELDTFSKRINLSKDILNNHLVLSPLFEKLGKLTIPSIQYTKFNHEYKDGEFIVNISGVSYDYHSIALQAGVFDGDKSKSFKNVVFSNLSTDPNNYVTFDLSFNVDPVLLSYENNLNN